MFENIEYDEDDRHCVFHHASAAKYYKLNAAFLSAFLAFSYYTYKNNTSVFFNETFGKIYLGCFAGSLLALYVFSNKHIQAVYLLKPVDKV